MTTIKFTYNNGMGHAEIYLDKFLPTTKRRLTALLKMIYLIDEWRQREEVLHTIEGYILKNLEEVGDAPTAEQIKELERYIKTPDGRKYRDKYDELKAKQRMKTAWTYNLETLRRSMT